MAQTKFQSSQDTSVDPAETPTFTAPSTKPKTSPVDQQSPGLPLKESDLADLPAGPSAVHAWQAQVADFHEDENLENRAQSEPGRWQNSTATSFVVMVSIFLWAVILASAGWIL